jgi:hypothetical protein
MPPPPDGFVREVQNDVRMYELVQHEWRHRHGPTKAVALAQVVIALCNFPAESNRVSRRFGRECWVLSE